MKVIYICVFLGLAKCNVTTMSPVLSFSASHLAKGKKAVQDITVLNYLILLFIYFILHMLYTFICCKNKQDDNPVEKVHLFAWEIMSEGSSPHTDTV